MGKIYKIPSKNSFLDSLVAGYLNYQKEGCNNLIILPSNIDIKLTKQIFSKYPDKAIILPKFTTLNDYLSLDDPFVIFTEYLNLPIEIPIDEFKLEIYNFLLRWQKTKTYQQKYASFKLNKNDFIHRFTNFFLQIEEYLLSSKEIIRLKPDNLPIAEELIFSFLAFFQTKWFKYQKSKNIVTVTQKQNLILKFKTKFLAKLQKYDNIILAGTTGVNPLTMDFINAISKHPQGVFIFHEKHEESAILNQINPNLLIDKLIQNINGTNIKLWNKQTTAQPYIQEFIAKNLYEEAEFIAKELTSSTEKQVILTNNQELRDLILFKTNKYINSLNFNLNNYQKIFKLFCNLQGNYDQQQLEEYFACYFPSHKNLISQNINVINCTKKLILEHLVKIIPAEYQPEITKLKHIISKITVKNINNKQYLELLKLISPDKNSIYYEDSELMIIQPKELRLINFNKIICADLNQNSWQSKFDKIFNLKNIKNNLINLENIRNIQIASDFLRLSNSKNIIFTRAKNNHNKENLAYIFYQYFIKHHNISSLTNNIDKKNYQRPNKILNIPKKLKLHDFYATEIEKLIKNPYNIYALKILKLRKKSICFTEEKNKIFGILVHKSLDNFLKKITDYKTLNSKQKLAILNKIFAKLLLTYKIPKAIQISWLNRFGYIASDFVLNSKDEKILSEYFAEIYLPANKINLKAKIDYISYVDKKLKIIDYKTGIIPSNQDIYSGISGQLIIELFILLKQQPTENFTLEFWQLIGKIDDGIKIKELKANFIKDALNVVTSSLSRLIDKYQNSALLCFPHQNKKSKYDDYYHLARIDKN